MSPVSLGKTAERINGLECDDTGAMVPGGKVGTEADLLSKLYCTTADAFARPGTLRVVGTTQVLLGT